MSVNLCQTLQCHVAENNTLCGYCRDSLIPTDRMSFEPLFSYEPLLVSFSPYKIVSGYAISIQVFLVSYSFKYSLYPPQKLVCRFLCYLHCLLYRQPCIYLSIYIIIIRYIALINSAAFISTLASFSKNGSRPLGTLETRCAHIHAKRPFKLLSVPIHETLAAPLNGFSRNLTPDS